MNAQWRRVEPAKKKVSGTKAIPAPKGGILAPPTQTQRRAQEGTRASTRTRSRSREDESASRSADRGGGTDDCRSEDEETRRGNLKGGREARERPARDRRKRATENGVRPNSGTTRRTRRYLNSVNVFRRGRSNKNSSTPSSATKCSSSPAKRVVVRLHSCRSSFWITRSGKDAER